MVLRATRSCGTRRCQVGGAARPRCFLKVSRLEAQLLLERYPECGNLLLRPSGAGKDGVSVTTRQTLNGYAGRPRGLHWAGGRGACSEGRPSRDLGDQRDAGSPLGFVVGVGSGPR